MPDSIICRFSTARKVVVICTFVVFLLSTLLYGLSWNESKSTLSENANRMYYAALAMQIVAILVGYSSIAFLFKATPFSQVPF